MDSGGRQMKLLGEGRIEEIDRDVCPTFWRTTRCRAHSHRKRALSRHFRDCQKNLVKLIRR